MHVCFLVRFCLLFRLFFGEQTRNELTGIHRLISEKTSGGMDGEIQYRGKPRGGETDVGEHGKETSH